VGVRERLVLLLEFREEADILNGDHGLVGESLEERDLFVGERAENLAGDQDSSDRAALTPHWDDEQAAQPGDTCHTASLDRQRALRFGVGHLNDGVVAKGSTRRQWSSDWCRIESCHHVGCGVLNTDQMD
jgi:hypothetical protein